MEHVKLYVNQNTAELGEVGEIALAALSQKAVEAGVIEEVVGELVFTAATPGNIDRRIDAVSKPNHFLNEM